MISANASKRSQKRPRVFMLEWLEPPFAPGHWVPEQVEIAGGTCLAGRSRQKVRDDDLSKRSTKPRLTFWS